jgi:hypothetical protein
MREFRSFIAAAQALPHHLDGTMERVSAADLGC